MNNEIKRPEMDEFYEQFREELRAYLYLNNLTRAALAVKLGVSPALVSQALSAKYPVSKFLLETVSEKVEIFRGWYARYLRILAGEYDAEPSGEEALLLSREEKAQKTLDEIKQKQDEMSRLFLEYERLTSSDEPNGKAG